MAVASVMLLVVEGITLRSELFGAQDANRIRAKKAIVCRGDKLSIKTITY